MADKKAERRGLGRGLSALMADVAPVEPDSAEARPPRQGERRVPIESIRPNPNQPRRRFDAEALEELAQSIREHGVIQPLILRTTDVEDSYEIVAGERRWRAAQLAQLHDVPAIVRDYDDVTVLEVAIVENIQRDDLNPVDEAAAYRQLMDRFGHTQEKIAQALGKSRSHIANVLRLLNLPSSVVAKLRDGKLSAGHARALVGHERAEALAEEIVKKKLSVREAEKLAKKPILAPNKRVEKAKKDADTAALEADLSAALGLKVVIDHVFDAERGRMTLQYDTLEQLDTLCGLLTAQR